MNREIKFRFWLGHTEKMTYAHTLQEISKIIPEFTKDIIPLQWTGLVDRLGKEIYEGDILQWTSSNPFSLGEIRKVQVNYVQAQYWGQGINLGVYLAELLSNEKCEVIGNIYETKNKES